LVSLKYVGSGNPGRGSLPTRSAPPVEAKAEPAPKRSPFEGSDMLPKEASPRNFGILVGVEESSLDRLDFAGLLREEMG